MILQNIFSLMIRGIHARDSEFKTNTMHLKKKKTKTTLVITVSVWLMQITDDSAVP